MVVVPGDVECLKRRGGVPSFWCQSFEYTGRFVRLYEWNLEGWWAIFLSSVMKIQFDK